MTVNATFRAETKIALPGFNAGSAVALGEEVQTVASLEKGLPDPVVESLRSLMEAHAVLAQANRGRLTASGHAPDPVDARRVAPRLPNGGEASEVARRIESVLFERGLEFLRGPARNSWVAAKDRLTVLAEQGLVDPLRGIGGGVFLDRVQEAHQRYGEALGITKANAPKPSVSMTSLIEAFRGRLREYVVVVSALAHEKSAGSSERADRLLAPIAAAKTKRRRSRVVEEDALPVAPAPVPEPEPEVVVGPPG